MKLSGILNDTVHRPWDLPSGPYKYYQEWNNALFLHWQVPVEILKAAIPGNLILDTFDGKAYVSLVAFTMQSIRPRYLPALSFVSDFHEINLRTYIDNGNKKGVYFLTIEAEKAISTFVARKLSGLPYERALMHRYQNSYRSVNTVRDFSLHAEFEIKEGTTNKTTLDKWLTERYGLYVEGGVHLYRYDVHHTEWPLRDVNITRLDVRYRIGTYDLSSHTPDFVHYSDGVKVLAWGKERI